MRVESWFRVTGLLAVTMTTLGPSLTTSSYYCYYDYYYSFCYSYFIFLFLWEVHFQPLMEDKDPESTRGKSTSPLKNSSIEQRRLNALQRRRLAEQGHLDIDGDGNMSAYVARLLLGS